MKQKNKKGLATLKEAMIGITLIVFCVAGLIMFNADISTTYSNNYTDMSGIAGSSEEIEMLTENVYSDIQGASESPFGAAYYAIKGGWDSFKLMFALINIGGNIYGNTTDTATSVGLNIPSFVTGLILVMISLTLIYAALSYIGRVNM